MADELVISHGHPPGGRSAGGVEAIPVKLTGDGVAGKIPVQWAPEGR